MNILSFFRKMPIWLVLSLWIISAAAQNPYYRILTPTNADLHDFYTWAPDRMPLVSAHRGGTFPGYPENCIETFDYLLHQTHAVIECDIAMTSDGVLVMMHDDNLDRTTDATGPVKNKTYAEIQEVHLKDKLGLVTAFPVPTLDSVLSWARGKTNLMLDIKRSTPIIRVLEAVREAHAEAYVVIIVYRLEDALTVHAFDPSLMISLTMSKPEDLIRANEHGLPDSVLVAFTGVSLADSATYQTLHQHGITAILGTMGNLDNKAVIKGTTEVYGGLFEAGCDILSTDLPTTLGEIIQKQYSLTEAERKYFVFPEG